MRQCVARELDIHFAAPVLVAAHVDADRVPIDGGGGAWDEVRRPGPWAAVRPRRSRRR